MIRRAAPLLSRRDRSNHALSRPTFSMHPTFGLGMLPLRPAAEVGAYWPPPGPASLISRHG
jgi:hypothetical protein